MRQEWYRYKLEEKSGTGNRGVDASNVALHRAQTTEKRTQNKNVHNIVRAGLAREQEYKHWRERDESTTEEGNRGAIYSGPGCQKDPMRPLAEFTISTARPTSPACWLSSAIVSRLPSEFTAVSTIDTVDVSMESGTGSKGLKATVGEFAGVGFLDLWTSSSSGIGLIVRPVLLDFDGRLCTSVDTAVLVSWG